MFVNFPPLILKITKHFHWLHNPLLHFFFSHSHGLVIFIHISFVFERNSQSETLHSFFYVFLCSQKFAVNRASRALHAVHVKGQKSLVVHRARTPPLPPSSNPPTTVTVIPCKSFFSCKKSCKFKKFFLYCKNIPSLNNTP